MEKSTAQMITAGLILDRIRSWRNPSDINEKLVKMIGLEIKASRERSKPQASGYHGRMVVTVTTEVQIVEPETGCVLLTLYESHVE